MTLDQVDVFPGLDPEDCRTMAYRWLGAAWGSHASALRDQALHPGTRYWRIHMVHVDVELWPPPAPELGIPGDVLN